MTKISVPVLQMRVKIDGRFAQEYRHTEQTFVEGVKGKGFSLALHNCTPGRLLVHPSVDGLSVMNGQPARKNDFGDGYILRAHGEMAVLGWRLNDTEVASFFFAGAGQSYAEKMYGGQNRGVIACAIWTEKSEPVYTFTTHSPCSFHVSTHGSPLGMAGTAADVCDPVFSVAGSSATYRGDQEYNTACHLGTGFGSKIDQPVSRQRFVPASTEPLAVALIYYNDRAGLRAMGISLADTDAFSPNPFPGDRGCTPPSDWQG